MINTIYQKENIFLKVKESVKKIEELEVRIGQLVDGKSFGKTVRKLG
jgi:hypothetical protein